MTALHRLVETGGVYPSRPVEATYIDFLGSVDPGVLLLPGDTWTQIPAVVIVASLVPPRRSPVAVSMSWSSRLAF